MRGPNWWPALLAYIDENRGHSREYGKWDCWQFWGGCVLVMTSIDYRPQFPKYSSLAEGLRILAARGGECDVMTSLFGASKHVAFAQRGDGVLVDLGEGLAPAVCLGVEVATIAPDGIETVPCLSGIAAWTV